MDKPRRHLEGLSDLDGTPCLNCPEGEYEAGTVTRILESEAGGGPTVLVVKEVPALVCDTCGDAAFSEKVSERLEELVTEAAQDRTRSTGVQSEVRHWQPDGAA